MQISRLFEIVYILMNRETVKASELAQRFEVSTRTIYRDIDALCEAGIPIYTSQGKGGGIHLENNSILDRSLLSSQEKTDLLEALRVMVSMGYVQADTLLERLGNLFSKGAEKPWIRIDFAPWYEEKKQQEQIAFFERAIKQQYLISFDYYNSKGQKKRRLVEPNCLVFRSHSWYLEGFCRQRKGKRFFKVTRMEELEMKQEHFETRKEPEDNSNKKENKVMPNWVKLVFRVSPKFAYRVLDEFDPESRAKEKDGSFLVCTNWPEDEWMYSYLLSYGADLEILSPAHVREGLIKKAEDVQAIYQK